MPPRLLILDELLSAGDASFQDRAAKKFREFMNIATGVLLATHNMSLVNELCDRCMWLDHGTIREIGDAREVTKKYLASSHSA
jgi:ABC-type polysaccharide/polyol phosphate transport system ATPase subunit